MDVSEVLVHILVVLLAAKAAAEISERVGVPAVVGEILAGILVGPSVWASSVRTRSFGSWVSSASSCCSWRSASAWTFGSSARWAGPR